MARREEILRAAQNAFLKYGIEKITLDDIAHECGIQKTALYYYFKSKEEIMTEMILYKINEMRNSLSEAVDQVASVQEKLRSYMKKKISIMQENLPYMKLLEKEGLPAKVQEFLLEHRKKLFDTDFTIVKDIIKLGIQNKKVSFELSDSLVLMILGVTYGSFTGRFLDNINWNIDDMIDTTIEVIFKGIE
ncbi:MAG: TetR/AcrR family transcriptional regulator [Candidatus Cloacimonadales bacterium]|nr:TetR/AcrR family transcriptional regulator [Candidatus Cloacimonadales bacterium]